MNDFKNMLRQLGTRLNAGLQSFMAGRNGTDRLNICILGGSLIAGLFSLWMKNPAVCLILVFVSYGLMIWAIFRTLSRNTYKRYQENRAFLQCITRLKDRQNRYYNCPKCRQMVRVPRGKGKISITCPRCREKFIKKT